MNAESVNRRTVLLSTAAIGSGLAALVAAIRPSAAFSIQRTSPTSAAGLAFSNRCGPDSEHAAIRSNLMAQLNAEPSSVNSQTVTCPVCGCPITVSR